MAWNRQHIQTMVGMMGYEQDPRNEHIWKQTINGKVYGVDFKKEEPFVFIGSERYTEFQDDPFKALKEAIEYASVESSERQEPAENKATNQENQETPASVPSEPKQDKPIETPRVPAQRQASPARKQTANSTIVVQGYTAEQIETIKNTVAKGSSDSELQMFIYVANKYGLDPFLKEIYYSEKMHTIITSRDGYLKAAQRDPSFDGIQSMAVCENDEFSIDAENGTVMHTFGKGSRGKVIGAWAICRHTGRRPVISYASYDEYKKNNDIWATYKSAMCCKVAEVFALKRQFGISGLVTQEEIGVEVV